MRKREGNRSEEESSDGNEFIEAAARKTKQNTQNKYARLSPSITWYSIETTTIPKYFHYYL